MNFLEDKKYKRVMKNKGSILVCAESEDYPAKPENVFGKCSDCKTGIVFTKESKNCKRKICSGCALKILEKIKYPEKVEVASHANSKGAFLKLKEKLEEEEIRKNLSKTAVAG